METELRILKLSSRVLTKNIPYNKYKLLNLPTAH